MIVYRLAKIEDAASIGKLHVTSWQETYTGLIPQTMLAELSADSRAVMWATILGAPTSPNGTQVLVAESAGEIVGFGACGGQRDDALRERGFTGEFLTIYVLRSQQGAGVGRALMTLMARDLVARRIRSASLWVLRENVVARGFYERMGGTIVGEQAVAQDDTILHEVGYGWSDLALLS